MVVWPFLIFGIFALGLMAGLDVLPSQQAGSFSLGLAAAYTALWVATAMSARALTSKSPHWADRLARLTEFLLPSGYGSLIRLHIHFRDNAKADQIWSAVGPKLKSFDRGLQVAMTTLYATSLNERRDLSRALSLLEAVESEACRQTKRYRDYYPFYWRTLAAVQVALGKTAAARRSLELCPLPQNLQAQLSSDCIWAYVYWLEGDSAKAIELVQSVPQELGNLSSAVMLAIFGEIDGALRQLPPQPESLTDADDLFSYHFVHALATGGNIEQFRLAAATGRFPGLLALYETRLLGSHEFLEQAQRLDPESTWTRQAQECVATKDPRTLESNRP